MFDIVCFGSNTVDIFVYTNIKGKAGKMCYSLGDKIRIKDTKFAIGGCALNVSFALKKFGFKTAYLGKVGSDEWADTVLQELKKAKIPFLGTKGKGRNNHSIILDSKEHNRTILEYLGESNNLKFKELNLKKLKAKWFYFSALLDHSFKTQIKLAKFAEKNNIKIAYNPGTGACRLGKRKLLPILKRSELLILNKDEAKLLVKGDLLKELHKLGPRTVIITDGERPTIAFDGEKKYKIVPNKVKVVERTGAGDAFAAGCTAGSLKSFSTFDCLQLGKAEAESVIQHVGATHKLLSWSEIIKKVKKSDN